MAIPHAKSSAVKRPGLAAMTVPEGIEYGAPDGKPSNLLFMDRGAGGRRSSSGSAFETDDTPDGSGTQKTTSSGTDCRRISENDR